MKSEKECERSSEVCLLGNWSLTTKSQHLRFQNQKNWQPVEKNHTSGVNRIDCITWFSFIYNFVYFSLLPPSDLNRLHCPRIAECISNESDHFIRLSFSPCTVYSLSIEISIESATILTCWKHVSIVMNVLSNEPYLSWLWLEEWKRMRIYIQNNNRILIIELQLNVFLLIWLYWRLVFRYVIFRSLSLTLVHRKIRSH